MRTFAGSAPGAFERILIYGAPKTGKTRLATALPWGEFFGKQAAYIAADPNAASLRSVLPADRDHLIVCPIPNDPQAKYDPLREAVEAATAKWEGCSVLIWDTITQTAEDLLEAYARLGNYAKEQITFGKPGTPEFHAHPTMGDYGAAQTSTCDHLIGHLFRQPLHLIVIAHEGWSEPKSGGELAGGPITVGQATIRTFPSRFDTVIRIEAKKKAEPGKPSRVEHTARVQPHGPWIVGVRGARTMGDVKLEEDPRHFWKTYLETIGD